MSKDNILLSRKQLAERWSVSTRTLMRWEQSGKLPPAIINPSGHYRFSLIEVMKYEDRFARMQYVARNYNQCSNIGKRERDKNVG